jgi:hypothetical protein
MWGPFVSNLLQFFGAGLLLVEWIIVFRAPPIDVFPVGIAPDATDYARWAAFNSKIETRKRRRSWLAGFGYFFLGFGLAIAAWQAYPIHRIFG